MQSIHRIHEGKIKGILSGFDLVRFRGTLRILATAKGFGAFLCFMNILLKDFKESSVGLTDRIRRASQELARVRQRPTICSYGCHTDKEAMAREIAKRDSITEGLIWILPCVESCQTFTVRKNAAFQKLKLTPFEGRCLHHYFYLQHPLFGFMQLRLQTWAPLNVRVNINGREWLAHQLQQAGIDYQKRDNCFVDVGDVARTQALLDEQLQTNWQSVLGELVRESHPMHSLLPIFKNETYYWSADETEWASDVMFRSPEELATLYPALVLPSVTEVGCQNVLRYLGRSGLVSISQWRVHNQRSHPTRRDSLQAQPQWQLDQSA